MCEKANDSTVRTPQTLGVCGGDEVAVQEDTGGEDVRASLNVSNVRDNLFVCLGSLLMYAKGAGRQDLTDLTLNTVGDLKRCVLVEANEA